MRYHLLMRKIRSAGLTHIGRVRSENEDAFVSDPGVGVFAVADGVGGARDGEVASAAAIARVHEEAQRRLAALVRPASPDALLQVVRQAVEAACEAVHVLSKTPEHTGAATTLTVLLVDGACAAMGHVGDSRLYMLRDGRLEALSNDHSVANELLRAGFIGPDEARRHAFRRVLSRCLGPQRSVVVDTLCVHLAPGDTFVLATDGLNDVLDDVGTVEEILSQEDLEVAASRLIEEANLRGGRDNATVVVVEISDASADPRVVAADLLRGVAPFGGLDMAARSRVVGAGTVKTWPTGATLLKEGKSLGGLWLVLSGSVCWSGAASAELDPGDWFGETALLKDIACPATIVAKTPVTVFRLPAEQWAKLARRRPLLALSVLQRLAFSLLLRQPAPVPNRAAPPA